MPELTAKNLYILSKKDEIIRDYLPDLTDKASINKEFLFNIINTVKPSFFPESMHELMRARQEKIAQSK
jgi:hypothetical protein